MMNNLPLQPLVWARIDTEKLAGIYCQKTDSYIKDAVSFCSTPVAEYVIRQDKETGKYRTNYGGRTENPYDTIDEAEHWAEHTHYASQMQPHVKPLPTKVFELTYDCGDSYITLFMTTDKQTALDLMESVQVHDAGFYKWHGINDDANEAIVDRYNDTHPLKPYASKIFNSIYEDSFSEWANNYVSESFASQLSIIEHELFVKQGE